MLLLGGANSVLFAVMPPAGRQLGLIEWQIGLIVSFSAAAYMISAVMWGRISDHKGRRLVIVIGMLGFGIGGLAFAAALDVGLSGFVPPLLTLIVLIAVRMAQSAASGGAFPATQAHIAENSPPERRAVALSSVTSAFALGNVLGPAAAGVLVAIWITLPLYLIAALGIGSAIWTAFAMKKSLPASAGTVPRLSPRDPRVAPWIGVAAVYFVSVSGTSQVLGFSVQDRLDLDGSDTAVMTSWVFMLTGLAAVSFQVAVVRRSKWSAETLMATGLVSSALAHAALLAADRPWHFLALALPLGVSFACVTPGFSAAVSLAVGAAEQGAAAGLVAAAQAAGFLVGPLLFAALYQYRPTLPFAVGLAIAILLTAFVLIRSRVGR
jgi:MFS family permease